MIYKLTLETEHPEYVMNFLRLTDTCVPGIPLTRRIFRMTGFMRNCSGKIRNTGAF